MNIWRKIIFYATSQTSLYEAQLKLYGWVLFIAYPLFYYLNQFVLNSQGYENIYLRGSIACIGLFLILKDFWVKQLDVLIPWIWWAVLVYTLPFFFTFMLLKNSHDINWILAGFFSVVTLALFVDGWLYCVLVFLGIAAGILSFQVFVGTSFLTENLFSIAVAYSVLLIYYMLFAQKKKALNAAKIEAMMGLAGSIAHEMRTPLASISFNISGLKQRLNELKNNTKSMPALNDSLLYHGDIDEIPDDIEKVLHHANMTIDLVLANVRGVLSRHIDTQTLFARESIQEAIKQYPFWGKSSKYIHFDESVEFPFLGNKELFFQILHNLIKNSMYSMQKANSGSISIFCEQGKKCNRIVFKDTGEGIRKGDLRHIFDPFFSKKTHGSGLGLFFCKSAMKHFNGTIKCNSIYGEFAEFVLEFPVINQCD